MKSSKNDSEKVLTKFDLFDERYTIVILIISFNDWFTLYNFDSLIGRYIVPVTLFDDFGVEFEQALKCSGEPEVYVIICAAKIIVSTSWGRG